MTTPYPDLEGKVAIITGAAGGFGVALLESFIAAKIRVGALTHTAESAARLQAKYGDQVLAIPCDVTKPDECVRQVDAVARRFGGLHILINNAALGMNSVHPRYTALKLQIEDVSPELWARFFATNVNGVFNMTHAVVPIFRRRHWGRIVYTGTSYFTMLRPGFSPYGPTKAACEAWMLMLSRELEGTGVTVNTVLPGGPSDTVMVPDEPGVDRKTLIPPSAMAPPMLGLFTEAGGRVTGQRFLAVDWDASRGTDPAKQPHRFMAWPDLAAPLSTAQSLKSKN
jgi:NAD(P)-dependent dehydrogenase (short-subunit alcohol dehydrogenase family)